MLSAWSLLFLTVSFAFLTVAVLAMRTSYRQILTPLALLNFVTFAVRAYIDTMYPIRHPMTTLGNALIIFGLLFTVTRLRILKGRGR